MQQFRAPFFFKYFAGVFLALLLLRLILLSTESLVPGNNKWVKTRIHRQLEALGSAAAQQSPLILFLGASEVETSFDPLAYDSANRREGKYGLSFNMAVRNNGTFLPLYFERVAEELRRHRIRPKILFVHFPISRLTYKALAHYGEMQKSHDMPAVYFEASLWSRVPGTFDDKLIMLVNKWLFGERTPMQIPASLNRLARRLLLDTDERYLELTSLWNDSYSNAEESWNLNSRGRFYSNLDEQNPLIQKAKVFLHEPEGKEALIAIHENCCGIRSLDLDPVYAGQVIESLGHLAALADHTVIVDLAEFPGFLRSRDSQEKRQAFLQNAADAVQGSVWSISLPHTMYIDILHLSPVGSKRLAERLSELTPLDWLAQEN